MSDEVRTCAKCGQTSVVLVFEWQHTTPFGATGDKTRELRCQSCGSWFIVRPRLHLITLWLFGGVLTLATCVGGLPFFFLAWLRTGVEKKIPVVPGAPVPPMRFRGGPPIRTCGHCSGLARSIRVTRSTHNGIPTGTEWEYQCTKCEKTFVVESFLGMVFTSMATTLVAAMAAGFFLMAESPGWRWGGGIVASLVALLLFSQIGSRMMNRFRHPAADESGLGLGGV